MAVKCSFCDDDSFANIGERSKHQWKEHREQMMAQSFKGGKRRWNRPVGDEVEEGGNGKVGTAENTEKSAEKSRMVKASTIAEANVIAIVPKVFTISSVLLQVAKKVTETEWQWPPDMEMGDWLDTYLFFTMQQRGILIGSYQKVRKNGGSNDS